MKLWEVKGFAKFVQSVGERIWTETKDILTPSPRLPNTTKASEGQKNVDIHKWLW